MNAFENIGKPITFERRQRAYDAIRQDMAPDTSVEDAMHLVSAVAAELEQDQPYAALRLATGGAPIGRGSSDSVEPARSDYPPVTLDLTGGYRLLAELLA